MKILFIILPIIVLIGMGVWGYFSFIKLSKIVEKEEKYKDTYGYPPQEVEKTRIVKVKEINHSKLIQLICSVILAICSLFVLIFVPASLHQVNAGEVAVVKVWGEAKRVKTAGLHFDLWISTKYDIYDAKVQQTQVVTQTYSNDGQTMDIELVVQYQIQQDKVLEIAKNYGGLEMLESRIETVAIEKMKSVLSQKSAMNIIETRAKVSEDVTKTISEAIKDDYCVNVVTVVLTDISFSDAFEKTVEDKMIAEQEKMKAEYEKEKAIIQAEQELEVAKLAAEARIAEAKGNADAQKVIADAEAYATQIKIVELARTFGYTIYETPIMEWQGEGDKRQEVQVGTKYTIDWKEDDEGKTLIMDYLKYLEYLATWNGELPDVVSGSDLSIFIPTKS